MASVELRAKDELPDEDDDVPAALERLELLASVELLATVGLLAKDELRNEGHDPHAALERHELPASVELLAKVELLAVDELLGEGNDMKAAPAGRDELPDKGDDLHEARERLEADLG